METLKRYNSVPVKKYLHAVCTYHIFSRSRYLTVSFKFLPCRPRCHGNEFWDKIDYISAPGKDNC